jgi:phytol kinase
LPLTDSQLTVNFALLGLCYLYVIAIIVVAGKISSSRVPKSVARKFLHVMIGNLCFIIPFFSFTSFPLNFPFFVAAPFILLTFLVSPASPLKNLSSKMSGLADVTSGGHGFGLVLYAVSYTALALFFSPQPYVIAAGILPMAYGDAAASLVGQKFGRHTYSLLAKKSFEGSIAMFMVCFLSVQLSLLFFSFFYPTALLATFIAALGVAAVATVCEALTPKGFDNLTVPIFSALVFLLLTGGI